MSNPQIGLFTDLADADAARIVELGRPVTLAAGGVLFRMGDAAESMFFVRSGRIHLTLPIAIRGRDEDVLIEERQSGETVGWSGLVPPHRFTLKAVAAVASELIELPRGALLGHFGAHPAIGQVVMRNVASVIGHRLQVFQTMWTREMQRSVAHRFS